MARDDVGLCRQPKYLHTLSEALENSRERRWFQRQSIESLEKFLTNLAGGANVQRIVVTVEARMGSSRLPGKVMMEAAGMPMLGHLLLRLSKLRRVHKVVVATTTNPLDDEVEKFCQKRGTEVYRGSEEDVLGRVAEAAKHYDATAVVEITADCPIIDPLVIQRVIDDYLENPCDLVSNGLVRTYPIGMDSNIVRMEALQRAAQEAVNPLDREHVLRFIFRQPQVFALRNVEAPSDLYWPELGLTLDEPADFELLSAVIENLFPADPYFGCGQSIVFLRENPELVAINADVLRKGDS